MSHFPLRAAASSLLLAATWAVVPLSAHAGKTLDGIKARGQVVCGVNTALAGFSVRPLAVSAV